MTVGEFIHASLSATHTLLTDKDFILAVIVATGVITLLIAFALLYDPLSTEYKAVAFIILFIALLKSFENFNIILKALQYNNEFKYKAYTIITAYSYNLLANISFIVFLIPATVMTYKIIHAEQFDFAKKLQTINNILKKANKEQINQEKQEDKAIEKQEKEELNLRKNPII